MKLKRFFTFILVFVLTLSFSVPSFADSLSSSQLISSNSVIAGNVLRRFGVAFADGLAGDIIDGFFDWLSHDDRVSHYHGPSDHVLGPYDFVDNALTLGDDQSLVFTDEFNFAFIDYLNDYTRSNSLGYSLQNIYSYMNSSSTYFSSAVQYNAFLEFISSISSETNFVFVPRYNSTVNNQAWIGNGTQEPPSRYNKWVMWYVGDDNNNIDFYLSNGHVNNYNYLSSFMPSHNWINVRPTISGSTHVPMGNWHGVTINENGTVYPIFDMYVTSNNMFDAFCNANLTVNSSNCAIFNTTSRNMPIYAYDSIDAIKVHDSGQPQPYYLSSNFGSNPGAFILTQPEYNNTFNPYNSIVNQIESGLSAGDFQNIINININSNGSGSGGGSDSGSDDDDFFDGLFSGLGSLIKSFFKGIADLLGSIADGLGNLLESITSIIGNLINNFTAEDGSIFGFLKAFMTWLPDPLPQLLTSFFVLAVIFGVIKLIKGAFS